MQMLAGNLYPPNQVSGGFHSLKDPLVGIQTGTARKCRGPLNHYPALTQHGGSHKMNPMKLCNRLHIGNH